MKVEKEIKFVLTKSEAVGERRKLKKLVLPFLGRKYERTMMFDNDQGTMRKEDARLRIRQISEGIEAPVALIEFSYKRRIGVENGVKNEEEIETAFQASAETLIRIFEKMGYRMTTSYERFRETFKNDVVKITLDEFPFGFILEIEGDEDGIAEALNALDINRSRSYPLSCDDVYWDLCKLNHITPKDHIKFSDPEMPIYNGRL